MANEILHATLDPALMGEAEWKETHLMPPGVAGQVWVHDPTSASRGRWGDLALRIADDYTGANIGEKITAAFAALPATGGTVYALGTADKNITLNPFAGVTKPVTLVLGPGTWNLVHHPANVSVMAVGIAGPNQRLFGSGWATVLSGSTTVNATNHGIVEILGNDCEVGNFRITSANGATGFKMIGGLYVLNATRPMVHDVFFDHIWATGGHCYISESTYGDFRNIRIETWSFVAGGGTHGLRIINATKRDDYHRVHNVFVLRGAFGVSIENGSRSLVTNIFCRGENATTYSDTLEGVNITNADENVFDTCVAWGRGDAGFYLNGGVRNHLNNITSAYCKHHGLAIDGSQNLAQNILTFNNGQNAGSHPTNQYGVEVLTTAANSDRNVLDGVMSFDTQGTPTQLYGIGIVQPGTTNTRVRNARMWGNATASFQDTGTGTVFVGGDYDATGRETITGILQVLGSVITPSATITNLVGTTTNNNAAAGAVGELVNVFVDVGAGVALTTNTATNVTSITLTAGDWDVDGFVMYSAVPTSQSATFFVTWISTTSGVNPGNPLGGGYTHRQQSPAGFNGGCIATGTRRISIAAGAPVYLGTLVIYDTTGTPTIKAGGYLRARRVR